jgi:hypothetical protein
MNHTSISFLLRWHWNVLKMDIKTETKSINILLTVFKFQAYKLILKLQKIDGQDNDLFLISNPEISCPT